MRSWVSMVMLFRWWGGSRDSCQHCYKRYDKPPDSCGNFECVANRVDHPWSTLRWIREKVFKPGWHQKELLTPRSPLSSTKFPFWYGYYWSWRVHMHLRLLGIFVGLENWFRFWHESCSINMVHIISISAARAIVYRTDPTFTWGARWAFLKVTCQRIPRCIDWWFNF